MQFPSRSGIMMVREIAYDGFTGGEKMGAISELIRIESDGTISFGDYTLGAKAKAVLAYGENSYKVKTYKDITK